MSMLNFFKGFAVTFGKLNHASKSGKVVTTSYPEEKRDKPPRLHGRHVLNRYDDGMEKCIGCELCAGVCPAQCIYVRGEDNPEEQPVSPGERYGFIYEINMLRCIYCGPSLLFWGVRGCSRIRVQRLVVRCWSDRGCWRIHSVV